MGSLFVKFINWGNENPHIFIPVVAFIGGLTTVFGILFVYVLSKVI